MRERISGAVDRRRRGGIWTHPVIADGRLHLRGQELLVCFALR
jgi:hypothetical protein